MTKSKYIPDELTYCAIPKTPVAHFRHLNSLGYACPEFSERKPLNVLCLGDSWTEGHVLVGNYPTYLCQYLSAHYKVPVNNWNLGLGARSSDYMSRTLLCTVDALKPDLVFCCFTYMERREYFRNDGKSILYLFAWKQAEQLNHENWRNLNCVDQMLIRSLHNLASPYEDAVNFLKNYKLIEMTLQLRSIPWCYSYVPDSEVKAVIEELSQAGWMSSENYLGRAFEKIDQFSKEDCHPGMASHKTFAKIVGDWFINKYDQRLRQCIEANTLHIQDREYTERTSTISAA